MPRLKLDALDHPNRRQLYDLIAAQPGACFRELARSSGIPAGTARHHLSVLHRCGLIEEHGHGFTRRFFTKTAFASDWKHVVLMREPGLRLLHDHIAANPGACQREILDAMERRGGCRSTTQNRLERLMSAGELTFRFQGRLKRYWLAKPRPLGLARPAPTIASAGLHPEIRRRLAAADDLESLVRDLSAADSIDAFHCLREAARGLLPRLPGG